jgi:phosphoglycolate phosphatase-like HAD superfamily hydrolase
MQSRAIENWMREHERIWPGGVFFCGQTSRMVVPGSPVPPCPRPPALSQVTVSKRRPSSFNDAREAEPSPSQIGKTTMTTTTTPTILTPEEDVQGQTTLPSWNEGPTKQSIVDFVRGVTTDGGPHFVKPEDRIAVFDNDGTLWSEQPFYFQVAFALDRMKAMAPQHPEWQDNPLYVAVLNNDMKTVAAGGLKALLELATITHAGMTTDEFAKIIEDWIRSARHPRFHRLYTEIIYQPMLELLAYLRANGFKTFIVSGGGVEFMRVWVEQVYGIPPEQVIGSSIVTKFEMVEGVPVLTRLPQLNFMDDNVGKPVAINMHIGRKPIAAFGNSDGDLQMLQWTTVTAGSRLGLLVHHTDGIREYAYEASSMGKLDVALTEAATRGWIVADMKNDWNRIFAFEDVQ